MGKFYIWTNQNAPARFPGDKSRREAAPVSETESS